VPALLVAATLGKRGRCAAVFDGCAPSGRAPAGGFRFAILAQRKRPAIHGRPPTGLIRPKPFAFTRSAGTGLPRALPTTLER